MKKNIRHVSPSAMAELMKYPWPGNVRELENVLERAFVTSDSDTIEHILFSQEADETGTGGSFNTVDIEIPFTVAKSMVISRFEKAYLFEALKRCNGNVSETAKKTGMNARTVWRKIKLHGLERPKYFGENGVDRTVVM